MHKLYVVSLVIVVVLIAGIVLADQIIFSTYYPAPYGRYRQFSTTGLTTLATDEFGNEGTTALVGIGTTEPRHILHVTENAPYPKFSAVVFTNTGVGSSGVEIRTAAVNTASGGYPYLDFARGSTSDNGGGVPDGTARIWNAMDGTNKLFFGLNYPDTTRPDQPKLTIQENGNVGIGTNVPKAILDLDVSTRADADKTGFLPPRMNQAQLDAIEATAEEGSVAYNTTNGELNYRDGTNWRAIGEGGIVNATMYDGSVSLLEIYDGDFNPAVNYTIDITDFPQINNDTKALLIHINIRTADNNQGYLGYKKPSDLNWKYLRGNPDHADQVRSDNVDEVNTTHGQNVVQWFQLENGRIQFRIWNQGGPDVIIDAQGEMTN